MKTSIFSAVAFASLAIAAPFSSRQEQTARIELEIEPDTFVQDDVPLDVLFSTADNPRLDSGISARVVSPDGVECQAFDDNENPLGPPFGEEPVQFSDTPVAIGAYFCSASSNNNGNHGHNGNSTGDNNINNQGQARIQLETSPDTFVQEEIPIGVEVSTRDNARLDSGISVTLATVSGVKNSGAVTCQAFQGGKPLGKPFSKGKTVDLTEGNDPVQIDAFRCDA